MHSGDETVWKYIGNYFLVYQWTSHFLLLSPELQESFWSWNFWCTNRKIWAFIWHQKCTTSGWALGDENVIGTSSFNLIEIVGWNDLNSYWPKWQNGIGQMAIEQNGIGWNRLWSKWHWPKWLLVKLWSGPSGVGRSSIGRSLNYFVNNYIESTKYSWF